MEQLSVQKINETSPYEVQMVVAPNTYRFVTDYGVEIAISFDLDDILESGESYMFNITNVIMLIVKSNMLLWLLIFMIWRVLIIMLP